MRSIPSMHRMSTPFGMILLMLFMMLYAVLSGAATAFVGALGVIAFGGVVLGIIAILLPLQWLVLGLIVLSFVVTGQLMYFARLDKAAWFPFLMGALFLVRFPIDLMQRQRTHQQPVSQTTGTLLATKICIAIFFLTVTATTLINESPLYQVVVSSKEYIFLWGLYLVLAAGLVKPELVERIWAWLPWLMLPQLPLIIYQRFVVMPGRIGNSAFDAVVGAFGGNPDGGGASGAMGLFCLVGIVTAITRWRHGLIPGWQSLLLVAVGMLSIALAEVKFMMLLLPIAFGLMAMRDLVRRPLRGVILIIGGLMLAAGILLTYVHVYGGAKGKAVSTQEYVDRMLKGNIDPDFINYRTREMGRIASIAFWAQRHSISEPVHLLIGHGVGSSRVALSFVGEAQKPYPFRIARFTLSLLLWETGLLGTLAYCGMLGFASVTLFRLSRELRRSAISRATLLSMAVAVVLFTMSLPYNADLIGTHQIQLLLLMALGYAALVGSNVKVRETMRSDVSPIHYSL